MVAIKANKEYNVTDADKQFYLEQGYDIYENGKVIEYSPKKTIKYSEHLEKIKEITANSAELTSKVAELTAELEKVSKVNAELTVKIKELEKGQKTEKETK